MSKLAVLPLFVLSCTVIPLKAASEAPSVAASAGSGVRETLSPWVESGNVPGVVAVLWEGDREESVCLGWADVERKVPMTMDSVFQICSMTKTVTGVAFLTLLEEGKVSLDDPVSKYLPEFKDLMVRRYRDAAGGLEVTSSATNALTLRHCLTHTGGFAFQTPLAARLGWTSAPLRGIAACAAAQPLAREPGSGYEYSNTSIDIAAAVMEVVTGRSFEQFLKERIFDPLGMRETSFLPTDAMLSRRAWLYEVQKDGSKARRIASRTEFPEPLNGPHVHPCAGAGLYSTPRDLLTFYRMLSSGGVGTNGARIVSERLLRDVLAKKQTPGAVEKPYSLGCFVEGDWFGHGGAWSTDALVNLNRRGGRLFLVQMTGWWAHPIKAAFSETCFERFFGISLKRPEKFRGRTGD